MKIRAAETLDNYLNNLSSLTENFVYTMTNKVILELIRRNRVGHPDGVISFAISPITK